MSVGNSSSVESVPTTSDSPARQLKTGVSRPAAAALLVIAVSAALAGLIQTLQTAVRQPERAVMLVGLVFVSILAAAPGIYILRAGRKAEPETAALCFLGACSVVLLAIYFFWVSWFVFFPADMLTWSENDFLNDLVKFSVGYPLYSPVANLDSSHYPPGTQLLTYFLAKLTGQFGSIPAYRMIQLTFTALAAFFATLCCRRILRRAWPESQAAVNSWIWNGFWYAALFLMAANSITNRFAHNLHGDALAQLITMVAYYLLLRYMDNRSTGVLVGMAFVVTAGFFAKQSLLIWGVWYAAFLLIWGRSLKRTLVFAGVAAAVFSAAVGLCYATWGAPFYFWVFQELSKQPVAPLRAFQHMLDSWPYFAVGLLGGVTLLRRTRPNGLTGAWLIWIGLITLECYTSGMEWMHNHIGPGCLMAGIWFLAGLASLWRQPVADSHEFSLTQRWIRMGAVTATIALTFSGLGMVRIPLRPVSDDAYRYVNDIEKEFRGMPPEKVLLDTGTWIYARSGVIMGDRASITGMLAMSRIFAFDGFLSRIAAKRYSRILVHGLHAKDCWYENSLWPHPGGIRQALLDNYREVRRIPAAQGPEGVNNWAEDPHLFDEIAVLEPKDAATLAGGEFAPAATVPARPGVLAADTGR